MVEIEFKFKTDFSCWSKNSVNLIYSVGNSFIPEEIFLKIGTQKIVHRNSMCHVFQPHTISQFL